MKYANLLKASAAATVLLASTSAFAADAPIYDKMPIAAAPVVPVFTWQGFYAGVFAGYAWGDVEAMHPETLLTGVPYYGTNTWYDVDDNDGFLAGGTVGYNWQSGNFVFGVEGELGYMGIDGGTIDPVGAALGLTDLSVKSEGNFYGAVTGRVGFAADQVLIYAKGGAAFLEQSTTYLDNCTVGATCGANMLWIDDDYEWRGGWTAGAGVEWAFNSNWSAKLEYMYFDFGDNDVVGFDAFGVDAIGSVDIEAHTIKAGLNYRF